MFLGCIATGGFLYDFMVKIAAACSLKKVSVRIFKISMKFNGIQKKFYYNFFSHKRNKKCRMNRSYNNSILYDLMKFIHSGDPVPLNSKK